MSDNQFNNGSLLRISLKDFMTYKEVTLNAGPHLNLVLGPNGTGKSALVCGAIIGLGGGVSTTGRSGHLGEYIRFGCDKAIIEIELFNEKPNGKNFLIQRQINSTKNRNGKVEYHSSFKLNGVDANRNEVREFVKILNINVDNLCQFLPQERVIEFVNMDPKTLLENTEKAAGDVLMFENHKKIVELSKEIKKLADSNEELNNQIITESELQARAEEELKRIQDRDNFKEEINWLKKKKPWLEYEEKRVEYVNSKDMFLTKKKELQDLSRTLDPLKEEVNDKRKDVVKFEGNKKRAVNALRDAATKIEPIKNKVEECLEKVNDLKARFHEKVEQESKREKRLIELKKDLASLEDQYASVSEDVNVDDELKQVSSSINENNGKMQELSRTMMNDKEQLEKFVIEKNQFESVKKRIVNVFEQRLNKLNELDRNTRKAYDWLQLNKDKFKKTIYPPIMTQINMKDKHLAKYVESAISKNDLKVFICEDREDLKLFTDMLKNNLDIRVNVALAPVEDASVFKSNYSINRLSRFDIHSFISDMFTAPEKVMAYLCKTCRLHEIPVGTNKTENCIKDIITSFDIRRLYTDSNVYNINKSRYDKENVVRADSFPEAKFLNLVIDEQQLRDTDNKIKAHQISINNLKSNLNETEQYYAELKQEIDTLLKRKRELEAKKSEKKRIQVKIDDKKDAINRNIKSSIDVNAAKDETDIQLKKLSNLQMKLIKELCSHVSDSVIKNNDKIKASLNETIAKKWLLMAEKKLSSASIYIQDLKNEVKVLEVSLEKLKNEAKDLRNRAKLKSGFEINDINAEIRTKFDNMPNTVEEIDNQIGTLKLRIESILDADDSVKTSYYKRKKDIEKREKDLKQKQLTLNQKQNDLENLKNEWLPSLEKMIEKINENFGKFMGRINCAGEVALYRGKELDAFDEYGIAIKVKFRHTEQLKELTSFHQSGGERSVSTMVYMIALQELTHVPFRVVDEINQGMDENNERSVFDLISETSSRNSSQYFLFSPKLLRDLSYTEKMKIHIIFNGPYMEFDWSQFNLDE